VHQKPAAEKMNEYLSPVKPVKKGWCSHSVYECANIEAIIGKSNLHSPDRLGYWSERTYQVLCRKFFKRSAL